MANLIGTAPNQVPTNGSLGTMAFQDADNAKVENLTVDGETGLTVGGLKTFSLITDTIPATTGAVEVVISGFGSYSKFSLNVNYVAATTTVSAASGFCAVDKDFFVSFDNNAISASYTSDNFLRQFATGDITVSAVGSDYKLKVRIDNPLGYTLNQGNILKLSFLTHHNLKIDSVTIVS